MIVHPLPEKSLKAIYGLIHVSFQLHVLISTPSTPALMLCNAQVLTVMETNKQKLFWFHSNLPWHEIFPLPGIPPLLPTLTPIWKTATPPWRLGSVASLSIPPLTSTTTLSGLAHTRHHTVTHPVRVAVGARRTLCCNVYRLPVGERLPFFLLLSVWVTRTDLCLPSTEVVP